MGEEIVAGKANKSMFFSVVLCESILALILVLTTLSAKYFFKKPYKEAKKWYIENIMIDIDIEELIKEARDES